MAKFLVKLDKGTFKNYKEIYTVMTISNIPSSSFAGNFTLIFTADGTPRAVSWTPSIKWPSGTAPTLTTTNGKRDTFAFVTLDGGTNWYGFVGGQNI